MITFAQITDLHITTLDDPYKSKERNDRRLRDVLTAIYALKPRPTAIIASGDLVDRGEAREYEELKALLADFQEIAIYAGMGNHDLRGPFQEVFPPSQALVRYQTDKNGFIQYEVDFGDIRLVMIDTLDERDGVAFENGAFCSKRAAWLRRTLGRQAGKPTMLALHHPPVRSGIYWMDEREKYDWQRRLAGAVKNRRQLRTMMCGHLHRAFHAPFAGQIVSASPATSIQLTLDLTEVDLKVPDGREILVEEPPGFTLHVWDKGVLTSHTCVAPAFPSAVRYEFPFVKA
ncbi:MAG: metallophosphoesterase [Hyphomonadaceae bacterium]|nr:metallophosphoesterase [Hyphomonadaceae bacterium]